MATSKQWLEAARGNRDAATRLADDEQWRSAVSRAYYAAHHGAHAVLCHLNPDHESRKRSIAHGELPGTIRQGIRRLPKGEWLSDQLHLALSEAYRLRVNADYHPEIPVGKSAYDSAQTAARRLVHYAEELTS